MMAGERVCDPGDPSIARVHVCGHFGCMISHEVLLKRNVHVDMQTTARKADRASPTHLA
jgi:hypothetical protein